MEKNAIDFLKDLSANNNRDWFHSNKKRYETDLKKPWEGFIAQVIERLGKYESLGDLQPKECIFRIHRDTRFSKDKTPYKTNVMAIVTPGGRKNNTHPGMYLHLDQGMLMLGGGAYFLEKNQLTQVRQAIVDQGQKFSSVVTNKKFIETYGEVKGEKNKRLPKEFQKPFEQEPLIANKQFYFMSELPAQTVFKDDILDIVEAHYLAGQPLLGFMKEALGLVVGAKSK